MSWRKDVRRNDHVMCGLEQQKGQEEEEVRLQNKWRLTFIISYDMHWFKDIEMRLTDLRVPHFAWCEINNKLTYNFLK